MRLSTPQATGIAATGAARKRWFREAVLRWYRRSGRSLPWRESNDPFQILIAEKLLQQTAARAPVIRAFREITNRFPTPEALAAARLGSLRALIKPLGFLYRASELRVLARTLVTEHHGAVPTTHKDLMRLPGVGEYISRAVRVFAFGQFDAVVDTNISRLLRRVVGITGTNLLNPARDRRLHSLALSLCSRSNPRDFNYALLDLTSLICLPTNPRCSECPLERNCNFAMSHAGSYDARKRRSHASD